MYGLKSAKIRKIKQNGVEFEIIKNDKKKYVYRIYKNENMPEIQVNNKSFVLDVLKLGDAYGEFMQLDSAIDFISSYGINMISENVEKYDNFIANDEYFGFKSDDYREVLFYKNKNKFYRFSIGNEHIDIQRDLILKSMICLYNYKDDIDSGVKLKSEITLQEAIGYYIYDTGVDLYV